MKSKLKYLEIIVLLLAVAGCQQPAKNTAIPVNQSTKKLPAVIPLDTVTLKETFNQQDIIENQFEAARLAPIRANFKRINSITHWTSITTKTLQETTEGGEASFYYLNSQLQKIITRNFGESYQELTEYYLLDGAISFVFEKSIHYNRPMYYDSAAMKENQDTAAFDFNQSEVEETRSYFINQQLLHQVNNQDCGAPFAKSYLLQEQKRIEPDFKKLLTLAGRN